jgi:hypothetical protein
MSDFFMRPMGFVAIGRMLRRHGVALPSVGNVERGSFKARSPCRKTAGRLWGVSSCRQGTQALLREHGPSSFDARIEVVPLCQPGWPSPAV